jgi:ribonuclease R
LTYDEVQQGIVDQAPEARRALGPLVPVLDDLFALYQVLKRVRRQRGAIEIESVEPRIVFATGARAGRIERIDGVERNLAHEIIEEAMIAANVCAAKFVARHKLPALYRVHEGPNDEKLAELRLYLGELGLRMDGAARPTPAQYAGVMQSASERPDARMIQTIMLRSLSQAVYRPKNVGHFGLALSAYAHFTSPIRRYPDLLLHRVIRHKIRGGTVADAPYSKDEMNALGELTSMTERRAEDAVRDAVSWLKCEYMQDKVGQRYKGLVTGVTSFGMFVELQEMLVDGLVHISGLGSDYFRFDPLRHRLDGERSGKSFGLAQPVTIEVTKVDLDERRIDFALIQEEEEHRSGARRSSHRRTSRSRAGRRKSKDRKD